MAWDGKERRSGRDRRRHERRSATRINIALILSGDANRRTGHDRRCQGRRQEDQIEPDSLSEPASEPTDKPYRAF